MASRNKVLQQLMYDVADWSDETFYQGDNDLERRKRSIAISHHLQKESKELTEALENYFKNPTPENLKKVKEEYADILLLLLDSSIHLGMTADKLVEEGELKLEVCKNRDWGKPDENGVVEHVKEKKFYVVSIKHTTGNNICFWRPNDAGYTEFVKDAGIYTEEQIKSHASYYNNRESTVAVEISVIESLQRPIVQTQHFEDVISKGYGIV